MAQNAGANQGGVNKTYDKSADSKRRQDKATGEGNTEAKPLDPGRPSWQAHWHSIEPIGEP